MKFTPLKPLIHCILTLFILFAHPRNSLAQNPIGVKNDSVKTIPDTLLFRIQSAQSAITEINAANKKGYDLEVIQRKLSDIRSNIDPLKTAFSVKGDQPESKGLLSYELILKDADSRLKAITEALVKSSNDLQRMAQQVTQLSGDSLLTATGNDAADKALYGQQIKDIKLRLDQVGKATGENLNSVNRLLASTSSLGIEVSNLRAQTAERLEQSGKLALSKQQPYFWDAPIKNQNKGATGNLILTSYIGQQQILKYFISTTWDNRLLAFLISVLFFVWVHHNFSSSKRTVIKRKIGTLKFDYLRPYPILATLIILLNITPVFEPGAPSLYIELIALVLLLLMTIHLRGTLEKKQLRFWFAITLLYTLLILGNAAVDDGLPLRSALMLINIFFIWLGVKMYRKTSFKVFPKKYVHAVFALLVIFNASAVVLNLFGRVDLAKILSVTGVIGLIQLISLSVFTQIMLDAFELQMRISSCNNGFFSRINQSKAKAKLKKALSVVSLLLWIMVLFMNLSLISGIWQWLTSIVSKPRVFGSIHFSFGNILFFTVIIYISNKLQKHVPLLFGEEKITFNESSGQKGSKVALARLVIIIAGVLLAVVASGLPMDKLTVVLGAFGVGIGLGMQNIVNNFVSGIILIFEKPFRIGDYVELADKKGKVRDIGIRSSKLLTPQGSEVIIPNGDLLSGRLVNWTLNNEYIKTELLLKVPADSDLELVNKTIKEIVSSQDAAVRNLDAEILINAIAADSVELKVLCWISNIYVEADFKNKFLRAMLINAPKNGIKML